MARRLARKTSFSGHWRVKFRETRTLSWRKKDSNLLFRSILAPVFVESYSLVGAAGMRYRRPVSCRSLTVHGSPAPAIIHSRMAQRSSSTATSSMGSSASTTT